MDQSDIEIKRSGSKVIMPDKPTWSWPVFYNAFWNGSRRTASLAGFFDLSHVLRRQARFDETGGMRHDHLPIVVMLPPRAQ